MVICGECLNCDADQCTGEVNLGKGGAILNFFGWATGGYILLQVFAGVRVCGVVSVFIWNYSSTTW